MQACEMHLSYLLKIPRKTSEAQLSPQVVGKGQEGENIWPRGGAENAALTASLEDQRLLPCSPWPSSSPWPEGELSVPHQTMLPTPAAPAHRSLVASNGLKMNPKSSP